MCKICYKFVKDEFYQIFTNTCKPILQVFFKKLTQCDYKNFSYQTLLNKSNKNVKCAMSNICNYKYLFTIFVTFGRMVTWFRLDTADSLTRKMNSWQSTQKPNADYAKWTRDQCYDF
jgi:hypothetical protein